MSPEYLRLKLKIKRKIKTIARHEAELAALKASCPHEEIVPKESYFSGSYYDTAHTKYWNQCVLCGQCSETITENHSWYG